MVDLWFSLQFYFKKIDANLLLTDADSLTDQIKSKDVYEEFYKYKNLLAFSEN